VKEWRKKKIQENKRKRNTIPGWANEPEFDPSLLHAARPSSWRWRRQVGHVCKSRACLCLLLVTDRGPVSSAALPRACASLCYTDVLGPLPVAHHLRTDSLELTVTDAWTPLVSGLFPSATELREIAAARRGAWATLLHPVPGPREIN
jgi:hypothetical protein